MIKFPGTTFLCQLPLNFFDNNILISMKKAVEHISVNTVRAMYVCISLFRVDQINSTTIMTNKNRLTPRADQN